MIIVEGQDPIGEVTVEETPVEITVTFPGPQGASSGTQSDTTPLPVAATGSAGSLATVSRGDHVHALPEALPVDTVVFDQTPDVAGGVGILRWNSSEGTVDLGLAGGNVTLQLGQEQVLRVVNKTGSAVTDGQVVRITGAQGFRPTIALASASSESTASKTIGVITEPIANNAEGFVTLAGIVNGLNTAAYQDGDTLWLSTTAGQWTTTRPTAPNHGVLVGWVVRAHNNQGQVLVHVQNGVELDELHDVLITSPSSGQVLRWNGTTWANASLTSSDVAEGSRLYFTNARALSATSAAYDPAGAAAAAQSAAASALSTHEGDTTNVHGITDTSALVVTSDARLTNARTPTAHASTHAAAGSDPITLAQSQVTNLTTDLAGKVSTSDSRLTDARTPTAHKATHATGGTDALTPADIGAVPTSEKGANSGVATLDGSGKIPSTQLPALAITSTYVVASQAAMLALTAQEGDVAVRTDLSKSFILRVEPASTLANWQELLTPTDLVASVDGRTGTVSLSDLYAPASGIAPTAITGTAVVTSDSRLSDSRTPTAHASSHAAAGSDPLTLAQSQVTNLTTDLAGKVSTSDSRLTDARTPTAHKTSHATGGTDAIAPSDIGAVPTARIVNAGTGLTGGGDLTADRTLTVAYGTTAGTAAQGNDSRLSDARTPTAHAASHGSAGSDPITVAQSQVTNLTTDLAAKAADSNTVHKTGTESIGGAKTFTTTPLTVSPGAEAAVVINGASAGSQRLSYRMSGLATWDIGAIGGGSNPAFQILRYNPSTGAYVDTPLQIANSTGVISLTGTTVTNTPAVDNNSTQVATTAFVLGQAASATPANLGTAAAGTSTRYARADHVHARPQQATRCTADTAAATTGTYVAPTGFTAPSLTSGRTYHFKIMGWYQAAAASTYAIQHRFSFPTLTAGSAQSITFIGTGGGVVQTIVAAGNFPSMSGTSQVMTALAATTANTNISFSIEGLIVPSANGTLTYEFTPSAAGTITVMGGTFLIVTEVA